MGLMSVVGLFTGPGRAWSAIANQSANIFKLVVYLMVMAAIPTVCGYYGVAINGWTITGELHKLTEQSALQLSVLAYAAMFAAVFVLGGFVNWMAKTYGSETTFSQSAMLIAYAATPLFVSGVTLFKPNLWVNVLALTVGISYATYLLYSGVPRVMKISEERGILFATSVLTVGLVVLVAIMAATVLLWGLGVGPIYTS